MFSPIPFSNDVDGRLIQLEYAGDGPSLLVVSGGPGLSHRYISPHLHPLTSAFRVFVYDQTGCGKSEHLDESQLYSLDRERRLLLQLVRWCKTERPEQPVFLMGHSFGALQVMGFLCEHPHAVDKAILTTSMPITQAPEDNALLSRLLRLRDDFKDRYFALNRIRRKRPWTREEQNQAVAVGLSGGLLDPDQIFSLEFDYNPLIVEHFALEHPAYDLRPQAQHVSLPILVLAGRHDFFSLPQQTQIADAFPNAQLQILEDCAHFPFFEQPARFTHSVRTFLLPEAQTH